MSLFQKSVEKKYLNELDSVLIDKKYADFQTYFANPERQENIRNSKEEQFQEGFLRELFVKILGYTLNPEPNFNLTTELKNIANSKKADGAILKGEDAIAVIELKGTDTTDLDKIETQAFGYKNHHPKCVYVITSNFEKLRFYIQNAVDHIDFDLFNLTREHFSLMWLCFAKDNLTNDLPLKIKESSVLQEENITKKLYADYSKFREAIYTNLVKNNPDTDKLLLFKKTQKLLDRFLFIFFAEDRLLVPANSITQIVEKWKDDVAFGENKRLYDIFKQYFNVLYTGRPKSGNREEIFAYNGGLFAQDEILDHVTIDDSILHEHTLKLSQYDFETDVDVNILGHIFEHSLGEIENVQAEIKGETVDKQKTKRKKDGIFYTPKYITKYIVENTVGKLCQEKRNELKIIDEEYAKGRKNRKKDIVKALDEKLTAYRDWLLTLTILDPACGSGAFLNQALDFLINEHQKIDELRAQLFGGGIVFSDITTDILEKNIFGVDLNEESVDIAKLSLWLRTAQKGRKLNTLSNNIKCGNSLIDDPEVAGEKAFNWQNHFPEIFAKGGFDVVIGNPPYFPISTLDREILSIFKKNYLNADKSGDIYCLFYELGINILRTNGLISFITSNQWLQSQYGKTLRDYFVEYSNPIELINFGGVKIFRDATVDSSIFTSRKINCDFNLKACKFSNDFTGEDINSYIFQNSLQITDLKADKWFIIYQHINQLRTKIKLNNPKLKNHNVDILRGILTGFNEAFIISTDKKEELCKNNPENLEILEPLMRGRDIHRYSKNWADLWLITTLPSMKIDINKYPSIKNHFQSFGRRLEQTGEKGCRKKTNNKWFETQDTIAYFKEIFREKIIYPETTVRRAEFYRDKNSFFIDKTAFMIVGENLGFYQSVLASKLMQWYLEFDLRSLGKNSIQYSKIFIKNTPIPKINEELIQEFSNKSDLILKTDKLIQEKKYKFLNRVKDNFKIEKISKSLELFYDCDFKTFVSELKKQKVNLSLVQQDEWEEYFNSYKIEINKLQAEITKTDNEIDQMVYELYDLTQDEIKIVEESVK